MPKIPDRIRSMPLLVKIWDRIYRKDQNFTCIVSGATGSGKSTCALRIAELLDPDFSLDRVVFSVQEFFDLITQGKLKRGSVIIFDEAAGSEEGMDSRNALSDVNKKMSYFITIGRQLGLVVFYISPILAQLDKRVRLVGVHAVISMHSINLQEKKSKAAFYWCFPSRFGNKVIMPRPRIRDVQTGKTFVVKMVSFGLPETPGLLDAYKEKKSKFVFDSVMRWSNQLHEKENKQKGHKKSINELFQKAQNCLPDLRDLKGNYSVALIVSKFGISERSATLLKTLLNAK